MKHKKILIHFNFHFVSIGVVTFTATALNICLYLHRRLQFYQKFHLQISLHFLSLKAISFFHNTIFINFLALNINRKFYNEHREEKYSNVLI